MYEEAVKKLPSRHQPLETMDATYYYFSADALKEEVTYSTDAHHPVNLVSISIQRAKEIISMNRQGNKPEKLDGKNTSEASVKIDYQNVVGQDDLTRFDKKKGSNRQHNNHSRHNKLHRNNK